MRREGLDVDSQTLWDQIYALSKVLGPSYDALDKYVLRAELLHVDETYWPETERKQKPCRYWAWCAASDDAIIYRILRLRWTPLSRQLSLENKVYDPHLLSLSG